MSSQSPPASASQESSRPGSRSSADLRRLAMVGREEQVRVEPVPDRTVEVFDQTLQIINQEADRGRDRHPAEVGLRDEELRKVFRFAEILGGYDAFNDLSRDTSPVHRLSKTYGEVVQHRALSERELRQLEEIHTALSAAVDNARREYRETGLAGLSVEEMKELHAMVTQARDLAREITAIMGKDLMGRIERAVQRLNEFRLKAMAVEHSVSGVFLVEDEVMYIPEEELVESIATIFRGVGNPYLANNIDGVTLLAARNMLIEVVSFYSYYGKHQIYQLFKHGSTVDKQRMTLRIRNEIRKILRACKEDNKLVLTRIMSKEEEQLDLSIEAIQQEAEREAVDAVTRIIPPEAPPPPPPRRGWLQRLLGWLGA